MTAKDALQISAEIGNLLRCCLTGQGVKGRTLSSDIGKYQGLNPLINTEFSYVQMVFFT